MSAPASRSSVPQQGDAVPSGDGAADDPVVLLRSLRARLSLSRENLGRLLGCSPRALSYWESGTQRPKDGTARTIVEMTRLVSALEGEVGDSGLGEWLFAPRGEFGGLKPIELVERGDSGRLWGFVYRRRTARLGEVARS